MSPYLEARSIVEKLPAKDRLRLPTDTLEATAVVQAVLEAAADVPLAVSSVEPAAPAGKAEMVDHPRHYNSHPSGVECIVVVEHMSFNVGNAVKYAWRADLKHESPVEDLRKAKWYIEREISRLQRAAP